jgi:hypothetical protein
MDHPDPLPPEDAAPATAVGYERRDVDVRVLALFVVGLVLFLALVMFAMWLVQESITGPRRPVVTPTEPVVLSEQLKQMRAKEEATLAGYGWVDRKAGRVRIPIDRAIDLAAKRGVPSGKGPKTEVEVNSHHGKQP